MNLCLEEDYPFHLFPVTIVIRPAGPKSRSRLLLLLSGCLQVTDDCHGTYLVCVGKAWKESGNIF